MVLLSSALVWQKMRCTLLNSLYLSVYVWEMKIRLFSKPAFPIGHSQGRWEENHHGRCAESSERKQGWLVCEYMCRGFDYIRRFVALFPLMHTYLCLQLKEIFGSGTACVVCPVDRILYLEEVNYQYCTILYLTANILFIPWMKTTLFVYLSDIVSEYSHSNNGYWSRGC